MSPNIVQLALQTACAEAHLMFERLKIHAASLTSILKRFSLSSAVEGSELSNYFVRE
jgi:hypothetical protein